MRWIRPRLLELRRMRCDSSHPYCRISPDPTRCETSSSRREQIVSRETIYHRRDRVELGLHVKHTQQGSRLLSGQDLVRGTNVNRSPKRRPHPNADPDAPLHSRHASREGQTPLITSSHTGGAGCNPRSHPPWRVGTLKLARFPSPSTSDTANKRHHAERNMRNKDV